LITPVAKLAVVYVNEFYALHELPIFQNARSGVFHPPDGRVKILNDFQGFQGDLVRMLQPAGSYRFRPAVLCAWDARRYEAKVMPWKLFIIPRQNVAQYGGFCHPIDIKGCHLKSKVSKCKPTEPVPVNGSRALHPFILLGGTPPYL